MSGDREVVIERSTPVRMETFFEPFTPEELEQRWDQFKANDTGSGYYIEVGPYLIFENGAAWHRSQGRSRGPLKVGSPDYMTHRREFIKVKQREIERLTNEWHELHTTLTTEVKLAYRQGHPVPLYVQEKIDDLEYRKSVIADKQAELDIITAPERQLQWEEEQIQLEDDRRRYVNQDEAKSVLNQLNQL